MHVHFLVHHTATPLTTADLLRCTNPKSDTAVTKQRRTSAGVDAQIEVEVGSVLVRARKAVLCAQWVARSWTEVGDLNDDALAGVGDSVAA